MPASKIQDEREVVRWIEEGRTYAWMVEQYRVRYGLEVVGSMFSNFRRRRGMPRRIAWDDQLIPWAVAEEHKQQPLIVLLRKVARQREGRPIRTRDKQPLQAFLDRLAALDHVVDYEPDTGFCTVSRQPHDDDIIRRPRTVTRQRRNADKSGT